MQHKTQAETSTANRTAHLSYITMNCPRKHPQKRTTAMYGPRTHIYILTKARSAPEMDVMAARASQSRRAWSSWCACSLLVQTRVWSDSRSGAGGRPQGARCPTLLSSGPLRERCGGGGVFVRDSPRPVCANRVSIDCPDSDCGFGPDCIAPPGQARPPGVSHGTKTCFLCPWGSRRRR